jgi:serine/threonine-protein kinase
MLTSRVVLGGRYELDERIGAGAHCEVWRAADLTLARPVAIKLLYAGFAQRAEPLARFRAEARHAGRLSHENIARVYDYVEPAAPHPPFLVMELIDGPSLADVLAGGPLDPARTADFIAQAAAGLQAAHQAGLTHRDVKPANLLIGPGGTVKVADFGISHAAGSEPLTGTGMLVGTPGYLAPERVAGAPATPGSDLYSLGVVGYECLAGGPPFTGSALEVALAHRDGSLPPLPASVPPGLAALVAELTARDPADRPASAAEVAGRARALAGTPPALPSQQRRVPWRALLGVAAVLAIVGGLVAASQIGLLASSHVIASPPARPPQTATGSPLVTVSDTSLAGQPVAAVVEQLRREGLVVRVRWRVSGTRAPGTVVSVSPAGQRPAGTLVTVVGALRPPRGHVATVTGPGPRPGGGPGKGHGHGGDGNSGGDGSGD